MASCYSILHSGLLLIRASLKHRKKWPHNRDGFWWWRGQDGAVSRHVTQAHQAHSSRLPVGEVLVVLGRGGGEGGWHLVQARNQTILDSGLPLIRGHLFKRSHILQPIVVHLYNFVPITKGHPSLCGPLSVLLGVAIVPALTDA